jgi:hypothetical protein
MHGVYVCVCLRVVCGGRVYFYDLSAPLRSSIYSNILLPTYILYSAQPLAPEIKQPAIECIAVPSYSSCS